MDDSYIGMIIHTTTLSTEESVISEFGGSHWELIENKFLLGASDEKPINSEGGAEKVTLTASHMPSHTHPKGANAGSATTGSYTNGSYANGKLSSTNIVVYTSYVGSSGSHNNMPPYMVVYIWERKE